jgi:hypothetical protein
MVGTTDMVAQAVTEIMMVGPVVTVIMMGGPEVMVVKMMMVEIATRDLRAATFPTVVPRDRSKVTWQAASYDCT